ncbi:hypothetical protein BDV36DRAFT_296799 [Aspergillus pseudocaelatus]|uniref:Azaphilone pigments biosynthesis cluster protein L N-terminal domain-containing protein n=1 Tax=Aspergillus pseudocaelatus TaxID=1825620 RepID=A0ABQ6WI42_9EURO|nr:hypothetical protein BDV36DRAFT_296799 [Aspergillus pseudocaelatus]
MADPVSLPLSILTLVTFAFGACRSLINTFEAFQNLPQDVSSLKSVLESLQGVFNEVSSIVSDPAAEDNPGIECLRNPLLGCGEACENLERLIRKCTKHSTEKKHSVRDWAMLRLKADQIKAVQDTLSLYEATIGLALGSASLRINQATKEALDQYNRLIFETQQELHKHISQVDNRLKNLESRENNGGTEKDEELKQLLQEKFRTKECLYICQQISESIRYGRLSVPIDSTTAAGNAPHAPTSTLEGRLTAEETTSRFLDSFSMGTIKTRAELERNCQLIQDKLKHFPAQRIEEVNEIIAERCRRQNERERFYQCLSVCDNASQRSEQARINIFENVHAGERAQQCVISNVGDLISAKYIKAERDAKQCLGQMSAPGFLNSHDRGTLQELKDGELDERRNNVHRPRNAMFLGGFTDIDEFKGLLLLFMLVILFRSSS